MENIWNKIDNWLIDSMDGFVIHLQTKLRMHYVVVMTVLTFGTMAISLAASMAASRNFPLQRLVSEIGWSVCFAVSLVWFSRSFWRDYRSWNALSVARWQKTALGIRRQRIIRLGAWIGILFIISLNLPDILSGRFAHAWPYLVSAFVVMMPILLLMYGFCGRPVPTRAMLRELQAHDRHRNPDDR